MSGVRLRYILFTSTSTTKGPVEGNLQYCESKTGIYVRFDLVFEDGKDRQWDGPFYSREDAQRYLRRFEERDYRLARDEKCKPKAKVVRTTHTLPNGHLRGEYNAYRERFIRRREASKADEQSPFCQ